MPVQPADVKTSPDLCIAKGMEPQISHLGRLIGWFATDTGTANLVVHMLRFETADDGARRRAVMAADPEWQAFRAKAGPYDQTIRSRIPRPKRDLAVAVNR